MPQVCSLENVMAAARFHARWETHAVRLHEEITAGTCLSGR